MTHRNRKHELQVVIPIPDWERELGETEASIETDDDVIQCIADGLHPAQIGRIAIAAAELTGSRAAVLATNKRLLQQGASTKIAQLAAAQRQEITRVSDGRKFNVRRFVGSVRDADNDQEDTSATGYVELKDPQALPRAERYFLRRVPGYIAGRLRTIAALGGDVAEIADALKDKIDEIVEQCK